MTTLQKGADPTKEVEVLKCIVLRENYVARLKQVQAGQQELFVDLMDLLRLVTLETIESIAIWRRGMSNTEFIWNGLNYLLRIPSDLDFLEKQTCIKPWLEGFPKERNPFLIQRSLDSSPNSLSYNEKKKPFKNRRKKKNPYSTPVLNDIIPVNQLPKKNTESKTAMNVVPSEKLNMVRIQEAERVLLQEEEMHGRYTRNYLGQVVPSELGKDEDNVHGTYTKNPVASSSTPIVSSKNKTFAIEKGKQAGDLRPLEKNTAIGRQHLPMRRSRAAKMEVEISRATRENSQLEHQLEMLKQDLEKSRAELELLEGNEDEKQVVQLSKVLKNEQKLERRAAELEDRRKVVARKMAIRDDFRKKQSDESLQIRQQTIKKKSNQAAVFSATVDCNLNNNNLEEEIEVVTIPQPKISPHHMNATQIQRVVRGKLGRCRYARVFMSRSKASLTIQSFNRMIAGKRRARWIRTTTESSMLIQAVYRGHLGRKRVHAILQDKRRLESCIKLQKVFRGYKGWKRSVNKRRLTETGKECLTLSNAMYESDLIELAKVKADEVEPHVLSLMQCCMILTSIATFPDNIEEMMNWKSCKRCLRRPHFLKKIRALATASRAGLLHIHPDKIKAVKRHFHDPNLNCKRLAQIEVGGRLAQNLLQWVHALVRCQEIVPEFISPVSETSSEWMCVLACDDPDRLELWEPSELDYDSDKIDPEKYVAPEVLRCRIKRPRPMVVVMSNCIPSGPKQLIMKELKRSLPGSFTHIGSKGLNVSLLQDVLSGGQSIILETDIGQSGKDRNAFLRQFSVAKNTLVPRPMFILVKGSDLNRSHHCDSNWPPKLLMEEESLLGCNSHDAIKDKREKRRALEFSLASSSSHRQLVQAASLACPDESLVIAMECLMILLNPDKEFSYNASNRVGTISWDGAVKLLSESNLSQQMALIDTVPSCNLLALHEYREHPSFNNSQHVVGIFKTLMWWILTMMELFSELEKQGGPPIEITKRNAVFASVVTVNDGIQSYPDDYEPRQDLWPVSNQGRIVMHSDGWKKAMVHLMQGVMRDLKVHSVSYQVPSEDAKRRLVINIHRSHETMFFFAYDPCSSSSYMVQVHHDDINKLLGPNSVEMKDPRMAPRNPTQLYQRLIELLALQDNQLVMRRLHRRLLRVSRKVDSTTAILTAFEVSPGEIAVDAYIPSTCSTFRVKADLSTLHKICKATCSSREKRDLMSKQGDKMVWYLVDRLAIRRATSRKAAEMAIHHGVICGRKIFEGSLLISQQKHLVSVHLSSRTGAMRVVTYLPSSSQRCEFVLSMDVRKKLLGTLNQGYQEVFLDKLFDRLHLHAPGKEGKTIAGTLHPEEGKVVVLDRSLYKVTQRVGKVLMMMEFCVPQSDILVQGQDDNNFYDDEKDDDTKLSNFRNTQVKFLLDVFVYNKESSTTYKVQVAQEQILQIVNVVDFSEDMFHKIACEFTMEDNDLMFLEMNIASNLVTIPAVPEQPVLNTLPQVVAPHIAAVETLPLSVPMVEHDALPQGQLVYQHGHKLHPYAVLSFYRQPIVASGARYTHSFTSEFGYTIHAYEPSSGATSQVELLKQDDIRAAVGSRQDLLVKEREQELIEYLVNNRLSMDSNTALCVTKSNLYSVDKVTPLGKVLVADQRANEQDVILPVEHCSDERGVKLLSKIMQIPVANRGIHAERLIVTVFESTQVEDLEQGGGMAPAMKFQAYNQSNQTNISLTISASDTLHALREDRQLLMAPHRRQEMAQVLLAQLRLIQEPNEPDMLVLPWEELREERKYSSPSTSGATKLFSLGVRTRNRESVIVNVLLDQTLLLSVYEPAIGQRATLRVPHHDDTENLLSLVSDPSTMETAREVLLDMLKQRLVLEHHQVEDKTRITAHLMGIDRPFTEEDQEVVMSEMVQGDRNALFLTPDVLCRNMLARKAAKVSDMYTIVTVHELVDYRDNNTLKGLLVRAYCPSVSQQASTKLVFSKSHESIPQVVSEVLNAINLNFDGVESHMTISIEQIY